MFEIFAEKYEEFMGEEGKVDREGKGFTGKLVEWVTEYKHNLRSFFTSGGDVGSLYETNKNLYKHIVKNIIRH